MATWKMPFAEKFVTGEFGTRSKFRIANNLGPHRGTDWARPSGTKIPAITSGTVSLVQWSSMLGWVLVHTGWAEGKTWHIGYSHLLEKPTLKVGDSVKIGQTIGMMGSTGSASSGPHLHATLGNTAKSVFWGKVYDLKAFIKKQIESETSKPVAKPALKKTTTAAKPAAKPVAKKPVAKKPVAKTATKPAAKPASQRPAPNVTKRMYNVKAGDSYWKIGKQFGIDYRKIQKLNKNKQLHPGDVINLD